LSAYVRDGMTFDVTDGEARPSSDGQLVDNAPNIVWIIHVTIGRAGHRELVKSNKYITRTFQIHASRLASFQHPVPLKILYCSLVRSDVEYRPSLPPPPPTRINNTLKQNNMLESIRRNFSRFISFNIHRSLSLPTGHMIIF